MSKRRDRIYYRDGRGYYADFRDYADVGGKRESLIDLRTQRPTHDADLARSLAAKRLELLQAKRVGGGEDPLLIDYAKRHLELKALHRTAHTVERDSRSLEHVLAWLGDVTDVGEAVRLSHITVSRLSEYVRYRMRCPGKKAGTTLAPQTALHELHALSSLMKRAVAEGYVQANPVTKLSDKPQRYWTESEWLEVGEAARVLRVAKDLTARRTPKCFGELIATFLLTGGRKMEVFGLEVRDVDFEQGVIHMRPNAWRGIKTHRQRWVPLWPQLRPLLQDYLERTERTQGLLFPAPNGGLFKDIRASLATAVTAAEITKNVSWHTFRHTYIATRLQTLDHGAPVSPYTVMREVGHSSLTLIERTYGHLLQTRHRQPVVEYREAKVLDISGRTA